VTKYAVCAGALLVAAILGHIMVFTVAGFAKDYPPGLFDGWGMILSTLLLWLVSLLGLGLATIFSVVFGNPLVSLAATCASFFVALMAVFHVPMTIATLVSEDTWRTLLRAGIRTWPLVTFSSRSLYTGESLGISNVLVWLTIATIPLPVAFWLFRRKAY
jgi:hypothetical protein